MSTIADLMGLPVTDREQDWEIEFADSDRLDEALGLLTLGKLDLECRSALALLILHSLTYHRGGNVTALAEVERVREVLHADEEVRGRMLEYWGPGFQEHEGAVKLALI